MTDIEEITARLAKALVAHHFGRSDDRPVLVEAIERAITEALSSLEAEKRRLEGVAASEREAREKCDRCLREKDDAMGKLLAIITPEQLEKAGIYIP